MSEYTAEACFKELQPTLREISRLVKSAPISEQDRNGLAIMILADVAGMALGVIGLEATPANLEELGRFMAAAFERKGVNS